MSDHQKYTVARGVSNYYLYLIVLSKKTNSKFKYRTREIRLIKNQMLFFFAIGLVLHIS